MDAEVTREATIRRFRFPGGSPWRAAAVTFLAWLAIIFLIQDPLHYLLDRSPESYGRFWDTRDWLLVHIVGGSLALVAGPFQFSSGLRERFALVHRWNGRLYIAGILLAGAPAFYLAFFAPERSFGVALFVMSCAWWVATGLALRAILAGKVVVHQRWMMRSYVLTFAFVTFRWLGTLPVWEPFGVHREAVAAWTSWVVPVLLLELIRQRRSVSPERLTSQRRNAAPPVFPNAAD